ncbi:MAG: 4Fe-4S dicluster domain-containing protein [Candidatus Brocadiia bacterium]
MIHHAHQDGNGFRSEVNLLAETSVQDCYQCGKCTAGCPMAASHDRPIHQLMRLVQLNTERARVEALSCRAVWTCLSCEVCTSRCPKNCNPAGVVDALRELSLRSGVANPGEENIQRFHEFFLNSIKSNGRVYELGLMMKYKFDAGFHFKMNTAVQDATLSLPMFSRGKLNITPDKFENIEEVRRIFDSVEKRP